MPKKPTCEELEKQVRALKETQIALKKTADALKDSEEKYRQTFESITDSITVTRVKDGLYLYVNDGFCSQTGYSREEVLGKTPAHINLYAFPSERDRFIGILQKYGKAENVQVSFRRKSGEIYYSEFSAKPISYAGEACLLAQSKDITDRVRTEEALRESEEKYRTLVENSLQGMVIAQKDPVRILYASKPMEMISGYTCKELEAFGSDELKELIHPEDRVRFFSTFLTRLSGGDVPARSEYRILHKDGTVRWVEIFSALIQYQGSSATQTAFMDITERKNVEHALRESEEKYRALFENATDAIFIAQDGVLTFVNPKTEQVSGYTAEELASIPFSNLLHPDDRKMVLERYSKRINGEELPSVYSFKVIKRTGEVLSVELNTVLIHWEGRPATLNFLRDITRQEKLEAQLQHARKMESLGLLAGGVAHDLNNILSGIVTYPELLLMDLPKDSPLRRPIKTIQDSGLKAAEVVADLLTIARGVATRKDVLNLNDMVIEYMGSPEHRRLETTHPFVTFKTQLAPDLLPVHASSVHIKKILMNLVHNASDAIEGGGAVAVATHNAYLEEPLKGYADVRRGEYAVLTVSDDGTGISSKDLERIFEPFYTKKIMGRSGTGLGLTVVWNTVQEHNGYINVINKGKGTQFELYFPATRAALTEGKEEIPPARCMGKGERILLVDDEARQREIGSALLTKLGYAVETVESGEEAIACLKERSTDLIVLDMVMPQGMNGLETYQEIIKIHPGQKAVIASGYAETSDVETAQKLGAGKFIRKPYTLGSIGVAVRETLGDC